MSSGRPITTNARAMSEWQAAESLELLKDNETHLRKKTEECEHSSVYFLVFILANLQELIILNLLKDTIEVFIHILYIWLLCTIAHACAATGTYFTGNR